MKALRNVVTADLNEERFIEAVRVRKSEQINFSSASSVDLFEIPANAIVLESYVNVKTAFDASGTSAAATATIEIPVSTGTLVIWDAGNTRLQSNVISQSTGFGITPSSGGVVKFLYDANSTTAGAAEVFLVYATQIDKL